MSPLTSFDLHEPQVPLSHDDGSLKPAPRSASSIVMPTGTATVAPLPVTRTVNGWSSCPDRATSVNASKCTADDDQCPVMSRTVSINGRGPQQ